MFGPGLDVVALVAWLIVAAVIVVAVVLVVRALTRRRRSSRQDPDTDRNGHTTT
jgi:cytochrome c-type biogenesis protein CcmH/NrfF